MPFYFSLRQAAVAFLLANSVVTAVPNGRSGSDLSGRSSADSKRDLQNSAHDIYARVAVADTIAPVAGPIVARAKASSAAPAKASAKATGKGKGKTKATAASSPAKASATASKKPTAAAAAAAATSAPAKGKGKGKAKKRSIESYPKKS